MGARLSEVLGRCTADKPREKHQRDSTHVTTDPTRLQPTSSSCREENFTLDEPFSEIRGPIAEGGYSTPGSEGVAWGKMGKPIATPRTSSSKSAPYRQPQTRPRYHELPSRLGFRLEPLWTQPGVDDGLTHLMATIKSESARYANISGPYSDSPASARTLAPRFFLLIPRRPISAVHIT